MESKKTKKADLQNKKLLFFEIGLTMALLLTLVAFNWESEVRTDPRIIAGPQVVVDDIAPPVTIDKPPMPKDLPKMIISPDQIAIAPNDIEIDIDLDFNMEMEHLGLQTMDYVTQSEGSVEEEIIDAIPFIAVEDKPTFMGEDAKKFPVWVTRNVQYPEAAVESNIQGTVYLQFTIGIDGTITSIKVLRSVDPLLDQEAIRAVRSSPRWEPGKQRNKPVPVSYQIPVAFRLQ